MLPQEFSWLSAGFLFLIGGGIGFLAAYLWLHRPARAKRRTIERWCTERLENARRERTQRIAAAEAEAQRFQSEERARLQEEFLEEAKRLDEMASHIEARERALRERMERLVEKETQLTRLNRTILEARSAAQAAKEEAERSRKRYEASLQELAETTSETLRKERTKSLVSEAKFEIEREMRRTLDEIREHDELHARRIMRIATERYGAQHVNPRTPAAVKAPHRAAFSRLVDRDGVLLHQIEEELGVNFLIDQEGWTITVAAEDAVDREIARRTLERLLGRRRLPRGGVPALIARIRKEVDRSIIEAGRYAASVLGLPDIHPELLQVIGRLKYRTSYTQNVLEHSIEAAFLCGMMAAEMGMDLHTGRRCALFHDIGKAFDHEQEGSHALLGGELLARYGESAIVVNAIEGHHEEVAADTAFPYLVQAADAISGGRPGARTEIEGSYLEWIESLERISTSFPGVRKSYAIQAGREVRVFVEEDLSETDQARLSKAIARQIESELVFPGQIRVTVIREKWVTATAN